MSPSAEPRRWPKVLKPLLHVTRSLALALLRPWVARHPHPPDAPGRTRVYFVLQHAYGMGGTIRAVLNLAGHLTSRFDVEIISLVRARERPFFPIPPGVRVRALDDRTRGRTRGALARLPSLLVHEEDGAFASCSALTDVRLVRALRTLPPGILITTRPAFTLIAARIAPPWLVTVAQEHVNHLNHRPGIAAAVARDYRRLRALVVLTEADRRFYAELCKGSRTRVERIPNALPPMDCGPSRRGKVVVTAGRLLPQKGFDLLIDGFAIVAAKHPDWQLRIYGSGPERGHLAEKIRHRRLHDQVFLEGRSRQIGSEFARGSLFALAARHEGFGLVVIEAMSCGLPVISFDSGGPAEIITHGEDGLLVPDGDTGALASALDELISDDSRRARMGLAAIETAKRFDIDSIGQRWEDVLSSHVSV